MNQKTEDNMRIFILHVKGNWTHGGAEGGGAAARNATRVRLA